MRTRSHHALGLLLLLSSELAAQQPSPADPRPRKQAAAVRVSEGAIRIDGRLNEEAWSLAAPVDDFVQKEPSEGAPPRERTEIRFAYDDGALFVGARMFSDDPEGIQAPLGRRDRVSDQAEYILISLDTFLDRRTAYSFGVSATGVRLDHYHPIDDESTRDDGFDPVWQARVARDETGWTAELWIPFSQLRFNDRVEQVWGLNVRRFTPTSNEDDYWVLVPRTVQAWASRFGELRGIRDVRTSRRLELSPVIVGSTTVNGNRDLANPFDDGRNLAGRVGADLKMGLGPNLTLDVTINPDFGQVDADPAEVNLTAFETFFDEKRPFFLEGARLLNLNHPTTFYSRRIGARPVGPASGDFVDYPLDSTILAAGKLTGRLPSGLSIGALSAVVDDESARVADRGSPGIERVRVGAQTTYGIARVQQEFGSSRSLVSAMVSTAHRNFTDGDPLADLLPRNTLLYGGDALLRFKGGEYEVNGVLVGSYVNGERAAMEALQRSSTHYLHRPDVDYAPFFDPARTALHGFSGRLGVARISGRHWLFGARAHIDSVLWETNDLGRLGGADGYGPNQMYVTYRETQPGRLFRNYSTRLTHASEWTRGWDRQALSLLSQTDVTWLNFWTSSLSVTHAFRTDDVRLTRGGPAMAAPASWTVEGTVGNSSAAQTRWSATVSGSRNELDGGTSRASGSFSFRPSPRWQFSVDPLYERTTEAQQYVTTLGGGRPETFGSRYIFAYIERSTVSSALRLSFAIKPDVNLDVYAEPFAASGRYYDYGELLAPRSLERIRYGTSGSTIDVSPDGSQNVTIGGSSFNLRNRDFNVRSYRSNVVLRWEWRPGSLLHVVWQQSRESEEAIGTRVGAGDLFGSFTAPGSNTFLVKTSFWLPVG